MIDLLPLSMFKENDAIQKTSSDAVKKGKTDNTKWLDSCVGTESDC